MLFLPLMKYYVYIYTYNVASRTSNTISYQIIFTDISFFINYIIISIFSTMSYWYILTCLLFREHGMRFFVHTAIVCIFYGVISD